MENVRLWIQIHAKSTTGWTKLQRAFLRQRFPSCQIISDSIKYRSTQAAGIGLDNLVELSATQSKIDLRKPTESGWTKLQKTFLRQQFPSCRIISGSIEGRYAQAGRIGLDKAAKNISPTTISILSNDQ